MPIDFSDEEKHLLMTLAQPIDQRRRSEFLQAVAAQLETCPEPGPGAVHRIARAVQRRFFDPPKLGDDND
jgi:hypothetical protein